MILANIEVDGPLPLGLWKIYLESFFWHFSWQVHRQFQIKNYEFKVGMLHSDELRRSSYKNFNCITLSFQK